MKISIGEKISIGFSVILALMIVMGIGAYYSLQNFKAAADRVEKEDVKLHMIGLLKAPLMEALTLNDYVISGDLTKKGHFDFEYETLMIALQEIEASPYFHGHERPYLDSLKKNLALLKGKSDEILKLADTTQKEFVTPPVNDLVDEIDVISLTLVGDTEGLYGHIEDEVSENKKDMEKARTLGLYIIFLTTLPAVFLAVVIGITLSRSITVPLLALSALARHVAKGDLTQKVRITSGDEIGDLSNAFNKMVRDLRESRVQLVEKDYVDSIIANMSDTLIVVDPGGLIKTVNNAALNLLGYTEEELIDQPIKKILGDAFKEPGIDDLIREGFISLVEKDYLAKDRRKIPMLFSASVMRHLEGKNPWIVCVAQDITDRKRMEEELKESLAEKEVLLKEVHHRVKNNLQVISSLLNLQAGYTQDPKTLDMFNESRNRIQAMALIHQKLYQSENLAKIDFAEYLRNLTSLLYRSCSGNTNNVLLNININDVMLSIDTAVPCGLLVNELVTNSLKHAFPKDSKGEINIHLDSSRDREYILTVGDNGVSFPTELDFRNTESLGMQLVLTLTDQLDGTIELDRNEGTTFKITFKEQ